MRGSLGFWSRGFGAICLILLDYEHDHGTLFLDRRGWKLCTWLLLVRIGLQRA